MLFLAKFMIILLLNKIFFTPMLVTIGQKRAIIVCYSKIWFLFVTAVIVNVVPQLYYIATDWTFVAMWHCVGLTSEETPVRSQSRTCGILRTHFKSAFHYFIVLPFNELPFSFSFKKRLEPYQSTLDCWSR